MDANNFLRHTCREVSLPTASKILRLFDISLSKASSPFLMFEISGVLCSWRMSVNSCIHPVDASHTTNLDQVKCMRLLLVGSGSW